MGPAGGDDAPARREPVALPSRLGPLLLLAIIWGASVPLTKLGLRDLPPFTLTALRYLCAAPLFALLLRGRPLPPRSVLAAAGLLGVLGVGIGQTAQTLGVRSTSASVATVISALIPIFVVVLARLRLRQAVHAEQVLGLAAACAGVVLVALGDPRHAGQILGTPALGGDALVLLSAVAVAAYYVFGAELIGRRSIVEIAALTSIAGAAVLAPVAAWELSHAPVHVTLQAAGVVLYLAVLVTVAGLLVWFHGLSRLPAAVASSLQYLQPIVGVALSAALFGDPLGGWFAAGTALVFAGIGASTWRTIRAGLGDAEDVTLGR